MSELKITQEKVTAAFSEANDCPKAISILTALFGKQKKSRIIQIITILKPTKMLVKQ